jgi:hypothetical protein
MENSKKSNRRSACICGWIFLNMLWAQMIQGEEPNEKLMLPPKMVKLAPLYSKLESPARGEWLAAHKEPGQTFRQYVKSNPVRADKERRTIYIQPLGDFTPAQRNIVELTATFMGIYFDLPVKIRDGIPLFSMMHCVLYKCNMCGSNHMAESDRRPLELCPQCLAKLCYATGADPVRRLEKLVEFYKINGFKTEQEFGEKSLELLRKK